MDNELKIYVSDQLMSAIRNASYDLKKSTRDMLVKALKEYLNKHLSQEALEKINPMIEQSPEVQKTGKRPMGFFKDQITVTDDFHKPLPDSFFESDDEDYSLEEKRTKEKANMENPKEKIGAADNTQNSPNESGERIPRKAERENHYT